jgi:hypothetical protein
MKADDWILAVSKCISSTNQDLENIDGRITGVSGKAILVEWEVELPENKKNLYRTWIPKSLILFIQMDKIKNADRLVDQYIITLPDWASLDVTYKLSLISIVQFPLLCQNLLEKYQADSFSNWLF